MAISFKLTCTNPNGLDGWFTTTDLGVGICRSLTHIFWGYHTHEDAALQWLCVRARVCKSICVCMSTICHGNPDKINGSWSKGNVNRVCHNSELQLLPVSSDAISHWDMSVTSEGGVMLVLVAVCSFSLFHSLWKQMLHLFVFPARCSKLMQNTWLWKLVCIS